MKTKRELKQIIITALKSEYGFAPTMNTITLLEASGDGSYILFSVRNKSYRFTSYVSHFWDMESIWCGSGTIERV